MPTLFCPRLALVTMSLTVQTTLLTSPDFAMDRYDYLSQVHSRHSLQRLDTAIPKAFPDPEHTSTIYSKKEKVRKMDHGNLESKVSKSSRSKIYTLQGSRWNTITLTYRITKYPSNTVLSNTDVDRTMKKAFEIWKAKTNLKFIKKSSGPVHIEIRFERKYHGDNDTFDGFGGALAHAFFPIFGGDIHFDDDEYWTVNSYRGTSLLTTATHKLGHSLGLAHTDVRGALMAPFLRGYERDLSLQPDDERGIQALYGNKDTPPERRPRNVDNNVICKGNLDAMVTMSDGFTYAFKGNKYWKLKDSVVEPGYPHLILLGWKSLDWNSDAAFTGIDGKTYFFKGSKYWRCTGVGKKDEGYPKKISKGFPGIPDDIDAAFVWAETNKIYFFKGSQYWKYDSYKSPPVGNAYPKQISSWDGIPNDLDAAMQYSNGKSYFFKQGKYYKFDDTALTVDTSADPPYPRNIGSWFFGCQDY